MKRQQLKLAILVAAMGVAAQSQAQWYDIAYSGVDNGRSGDNSPVTASGMIDVSGNLVIGGSLDVTFENLTTLTTSTTSYVLAPGSGNDGYFSWDSQINMSANPYFDSTGLLFIINGNTPGNGQPEINLYANGPGNYGLWGYPGHWDYAPQSDGGTVNLVAVPEPTATAKFAGFSALGLLGLVTLRQKFSRAA